MMTAKKCVLIKVNNASFAFGGWRLAAVVLAVVLVVVGAVLVMLG